MIQHGQSSCGLDFEARQAIVPVLGLGGAKKDSHFSNILLLTDDGELNSALHCMKCIENGVRACVRARKKTLLIFQ